MNLVYAPYDRRAIFAWSTYDFANSAFNTLVTTFIYSTYFTQAIAVNAQVGASQWGLAIAISAISVALLSPFLGALADRGGYRKRFLVLATLITVVATFGLFFPQPGQVFFALGLFVLANTIFELSFVFYNAFLPVIAPPERIGRVSGNAWAVGFVGGLLCLMVGYGLFVAPATPILGLSTETGANIRATNLLVAAWFLVFSIPALLYLPSDVRSGDVRPLRLLRNSFTELKTTFQEVRRYRQIVRLLVARLLYNDGLLTIISFGGLYAAETFGFTFGEIFIFGIVLNVAAGVGAFALGFLDDRIGGKRTILITIVGLSLATLIAFAAQTKAGLWLAGGLVGLFIGPNQSASRSLLGRFVPQDKENEFYGFFAFSGKATAFVGPLLFSGMTTLFGSQRAGVGSVLLFFIAGGLLLLRVDEKEGTSLARRALDQPPSVEVKT